MMYKEIDDSCKWAFEKDKWPLWRVELVLRALDAKTVHDTLQTICVNGRVQVLDVALVEEK